jgi:hypothetical protein
MRWWCKMNSDPIAGTLKVAETNSGWERVLAPMLLPSTRVPVHARFWKACIVCGRGPCKSTASALLRTKGRRVARKASAAVCEHCGGMRTAPALHWVFGESWAWAGGHTRWAPRLWRHGTFVKDSCVDSHIYAERSLLL